MEELKSKAGELTDSISDYIRTYYKLSVLNITDKATGIAASALAVAAAMMLGIFVLLFSGVALGIWLGHLLDNMAGGFLLVAGLYLLILVIILALKKKIIFPVIRNQIINKIYEPDDQKL